MGKIAYRNKGTKQNIVISIAGAHGVGKTTIYNILKKNLENNHKFKFFPERYKKIPPFPFGSSDKQIAFRSEMHFLQQFIKRNQNVLNFDKKYNGRIIILDRTPICVLIYSKTLGLKEDDYSLISDMYKSVKWREDYIIYLTALPETILRRIIQRGSLEKIRKQWNEFEKDYLIKILSTYDQMLLSKNHSHKLFIIDTNDLSEDDVVKEVKYIITQISGYAFKKLDKIPITQKTLSDFLV
ncbi:MAG: deoxynucleoside kinase [Candidatus Heimdallarchaeota archaeon]